VETQRAAERARVVRTVAVVVGVLVIVGGLFGLSALLSGDSLPDDSVAPEVAGEALAAFPDSGEDPAAGAEAPDVTGSDYTGAPTAIGEAGTPQVIVFLAHWCPHCQREVPVLRDWVDEGGLPEGVELVGVSTLQDQSRGNWPPQDWLADEEWPGAVLVDRGEAVATAYGMGGTPFWVFVDADGQVVSRAAGELPASELDARVAAIAG